MVCVKEIMVCVLLGKLTGNENKKNSGGWGNHLKEDCGFLFYDLHWEKNSSIHGFLLHMWEEKNKSMKIN